MRTHLSLLIAILLPNAISAQFSGAVIIDGSATALGVTAIASADVDQDGRIDMLTANGYDQGRVMLYPNGPDLLVGAAPTVVDADIPFAEDLVTVDLDGDGWVDVVSISRTAGTVVAYPNIEGTFGAPVLIDSGSVALNALAAGDVDGNGTPDIVVVGQHSIDLLRNDGEGAFAKEAILTTATTPLPLECMDLQLVDIDADGDLDPITAETIGPVIYTNDGDGTFVSFVVDPQPAIQARVDVGDLDGDGDLDILVVSFLGGARWYRNDGGSWSAGGTVVPGAAIRGLKVFDADGDAIADVLTTRGSQLWFHRGTGGGAYAPDVLVFTSGQPILDEVTVADVNGDGRPDAVWSAPAGTLGYQLNEPHTGLPEHILQGALSLRGTPDGGALIINTSTGEADHFVLHDATGRRLVDLGRLPSGTTMPLAILPRGVLLLHSQRHGTVRWIVP